ncbi:MAG: hypothetical protein PHN39_01265 [Candidatus Pacebacteria bacterium]|nr:hypothetical protein [Candidatus Paceibacterota bacterium]
MAQAKTINPKSNTVQRPGLWQKIQGWQPEKRRLFLFIILAILCIPFFMVAGINLKHQTQKWGQRPLLKTDFEKSGTQDAQDSFGQFLESSQELDQSLKALEQMESEMSTSEKEALEKELEAEMAGVGTTTAP